MIGQHLGSYRITSKIGEGGMGAVYTAEHTLIGRMAAVKVLLPAFCNNQEIVNRFFNEAKAATAIKHPGIVEIYDFGYQPDGSAFIVMEFLEGEALSDRIARLRSVPVDQALHICGQVAGALAAAHAQGIIHRDLKPDNIFLVPDPDVAGGERAKLLDFGIAKLADEHNSGSVKTRTGAVMGTPSYMSPEQCKGAGEVDHRSDLYALGCILYEMLCGRPPFVAAGSGEVLAQHIYQVPEPPCRLAPGIAPDIEALIMQLLQKDAAARPRSAAELKLAVDGMAGRGQHGVGITAAGAPTVAASGPYSAAVSAPPTVPFGTPLAASQTPPLTTLSAAAGVTSASPPTPATAPSAGGRAALIAGVLVLAVGGGIFALVRSGGGEARGGSAAEPAAATAPVTPTQDPAPAREAPARAPAPAHEAPVPVATSAPPTEAPAISQPAAPKKIRLRIESEPAGATVYRQPSGVKVGTTPYETQLVATEGSLEFVLKKRGYETTVVEMSAGVNGERVVRLDKIRTRARPKEPAPEPEEEERLNPFEK